MPHISELKHIKVWVTKNVIAPTETSAVGSGLISSLSRSVHKTEGLSPGERSGLKPRVCPSIDIGFF